MPTPQPERIRLTFAGEPIELTKRQARLLTDLYPNEVSDTARLLINGPRRTHPTAS
jgi:hypothetical protein